MTLEARLHLARPGGFALDIDLRLPGRGVSALFGPSGCGKTTVLRALAGLERAAGRVTLGGEIWQDDAQGLFVPPHRRALGYVIQEAALFPHLSVRGNLAFGRRRAGAAAQAVALPAVVDLLDIGALMDRDVHGLSGGERQRVAIARALATGPRLLLMDEPLSALDAARKSEILPYLERLHRELALPIVYVTHAIDEVARLADHLVLMDAGQVQASGPLQALLARPDLPLTRLDDAGVVIDGEVLAHEAHWRLARVGFAGGTLWVGDLRAPVGARVRARVMARDVSVARTRPDDSSIVNLLPVVLLQVRREAGSALLKLAVAADDDAPPGPVHLLARITLRSCDMLALREGDRLTAQIKGVALM